MSDVKVRGGYRAMARRIITSIEDLVQETELNTVELSGQLENLRYNLETIDEYDRKIQTTLGEEEMMKDMTESFNRRLEIKKAIGMAESCLAQVRDSVNYYNSNIHSKTMKLPTLNLPTFDGNPLDYTHFWDMFNSAVNSRRDISDSQKLSYLKGQLKGEALKLLDGLNTTDANYQEAVKLLADTFGDSKRIIQSHLHALFDLESPLAASDDLAKFRSAFECHIRCLKVLGTKVEEGGFIIVALLLRKLPSKVRDNINRTSRCKYWELDDFRKAINEEIHLLQAIEPEKKEMYSQKQRARKPEQRDKRATASFNINSEQKQSLGKKLCRLCYGLHVYYQCSKYPTPQDKSNRVKEMGLCLKCLSNNHLVRDCKSTQLCKECNGNHNTSLCFKSGPVTALAPSNFGVALPLATVHVETTRGLASLRALFDQGSQRSFILKSVASELKLKVVGKCHLKVDGFQSEGRLMKYEIVECKVKVCDSFIAIKALVTKGLPSRINMPGLRDAARMLKERGLRLADPYNSDYVGNISLLIGSDHYFKFVTGYKVHRNISTLSSKLGSMVVGELPKIGCKDFNTNIITVLKISESTERSSIDENLRKLWSLEAIGINVEDLSNQDKLLVEKLEKGLRYENGRYYARLPWKTEPPPLKPDYGIAKGRLLNLLKALRSRNELEAYDSVIKEQLRKNFIEKVEPKNIFSSDYVIHYLPHHGVRKESKTTPLRVVFDCSSGSPSLNDCLHIGPSLNNEIFRLLIRFRTGKYACSSDIEKAYLHIYLNEEDKDCARFLWPKDVHDPNSGLEIFRFNRVLFGANCSQFILNSAIRHHLRRFDDKVSQSILDGLYVDNLFYCADDITDIRDYYERTKDIFSSANLFLREWISNSEELREWWRGLDETSLSEESLVKVLGLGWNLETDDLSVSEFNIDIWANTKRAVLSNIAKVYDPLGLITPVTIRAKIFLQDLWKAKIGWEDILNEEHLQEWRDLAKDLQVMSSLSFPRGVVGNNITLHSFSDASGRAYGAVVYVVSDNGAWILTSKARVAPIRQLTIPQLELTAVVVGARLLNEISAALKRDVKTVHLWSDSQIVLHWITNGKTLKPYLQNRVDEIKGLVPGAAFHFVSTRDNPSDLLSRGAKQTKLRQSSLWMHGPPWLREEKKWPPWPSIKTQEEISEVSVLEVKVLDSLLDFSRYGRFLKILKVMALIIRFIRNLRCGTKVTSIRHSKIVDHRISGKDLEDAENRLAKLIQRECFADEREYLMEEKIRKPNLLKQVRCFMKDDLIRCQRRLDHSLLGYDSRFPILLPRGHDFTRLIIKHYHEKHLHAGLAQTLTLISKKYYIPQIRQSVKKQLRRCVVCKRLTGTSYKAPPPPPLPEDRCRLSRPFAVTGVDYTGALYVKGRRGLEKTYIVLFTCASTRGVHMELVDDNTSESFLKAFKRFVSRRSYPSVLYSDNATTFRSAAEMLSNISNDKRVRDFLRDHRLTWNFTVAKAPWFGGYWERLIGLTKTTLKKVLGNASVSKEELSTVIIEIEMHLNDRPLTYVENDPNFESISPSELMYGYKLNSPPTPEDELKVDSSGSTRKGITRRLRYVLRLAEDFRKKWSEEYLISLRDYKGNRKGYKIPKEGDIVLIKNDQQRLSWRLGRIVRLHLGKDGHARSAEIRTRQGILVRPVVKLYPLEVDEETEYAKGNSFTRPMRTAALKAREKCRSQE